MRICVSSSVALFPQAPFYSRSVYITLYNASSKEPWQRSDQPASNLLRVGPPGHRCFHFPGQSGSSPAAGLQAAGSAAAPPRASRDWPPRAPSGEPSVSVSLVLGRGSTDNHTLVLHFPEHVAEIAGKKPMQKIFLLRASFSPSNSA